MVDLFVIFMVSGLEVRLGDIEDSMVYLERVIREATKRYRDPQSR